jgi:hypothetical protein
MDQDSSRWRVFASITGLVVVAAICVAGMIWAFRAAAIQMKQEAHIFRPEIVLTLLLVVMLVGLILALVVVAYAFNLLGLSNKEGSLGLPDGSVQAFIALSLILIFAIMAVYLYSQLRAPATATLTLSREQAASIPADQIISQSPVVTKSGAKKVLIVRILPGTVSEDFAKQIGTTVSTLVVAIAGFYFGSRAVVSGTNAVDSGTSEKPPPTLRVVKPKPNGPVPLPLKEGETLEIDVSTDPPYQDLTLALHGDEDGTLLRRTGGRSTELEYTRGSHADDRVDLQISLKDHPETLVHVYVTTRSERDRDRDRSDGPSEHGRQT